MAPPGPVNLRLEKPAPAPVPASAVAVHAVPLAQFTVNVVVPFTGLLILEAAIEPKFNGTVDALQFETTVAETCKVVLVLPADAAPEIEASANAAAIALNIRRDMVATPFG